MDGGAGASRPARSPAPQLVAAGDVGTDGVTDYVLGLTLAHAPARRCGAGTVAETSLLVVDGRTGETSSPFGALPDICWTRRLQLPDPAMELGDRLHRRLHARATAGPEVVVVPYYADPWTGLEPRADAAAGSSCARRPRPSSRSHHGPAFDRAYNAANPTPCSPPAPGGPCYTPNSHVANAVFPAGRRAGCSS